MDLHRLDAAVEGGMVSSTWPSGEARERYIEFLELELRVMKNASEGTIDPALLERFNRLLDEWFPRTRLYLEKKISADAGGGLTDEIRAIAWAEARALPDGSGHARVPGAWTESQISDDINECFKAARRRAGL
jgi:hypothetical protein